MEICRVCEQKLKNFPHKVGMTSLELFKSNKKQLNILIILELLPAISTHFFQVPTYAATSVFFLTNTCLQLRFVAQLLPEVPSGAQNSSVLGRKGR